MATQDNSFLRFEYGYLVVRLEEEDEEIHWVPQVVFSDKRGADRYIEEMGYKRGKADGMAEVITVPMGMRVNEAGIRTANSVLPFDNWKSFGEIVE